MSVDSAALRRLQDRFPAWTVWATTHADGRVTYCADRHTAAGREDLQAPTPDALARALESAD